MLPPLELRVIFPPNVAVPLSVMAAFVVVMLLLSCTVPDELKPPLAFTAPLTVSNPPLVMLTEPVLVVSAAKLQVPVVNVAEVTVPEVVKFTVPVVVTDRSPKELNAPLKVIAPEPAFKVRAWAPVIVLLNRIAPLLAMVPAPVRITAPGKVTEPVVIVLLPKFSVPDPKDTELAYRALLRVVVPEVVIDKAPKEVPEEPNAPFRVMAPVPAFRVKFCVPLIAPKLIPPPLELRVTLPPNVAVPLSVMAAFVVLILLFSCTVPDELNPPGAVMAPPTVSNPLLVILREPVLVVNAAKLQVPVVNVAEVTVPELAKLTVPVVVTDKDPKEPTAPLKVTVPDPALKVSACAPETAPLKIIAPLLAEVFTVPAPVNMTAPGKVTEPAVIVLLPKFRVPEPNDTELAYRELLSVVVPEVVIDKAPKDVPEVPSPPFKVITPVPAFRVKF
jgi:hypothetical protein